jgi:hypothetical protein
VAILSLAALGYLVIWLGVMTLGVLVVSMSEFGDTDCDCAELQERLETIDWTGSGEGLAFDEVAVADDRVGSPPGYDGYLLQSQAIWDYDFDPDLGERIIDRLNVVPEATHQEISWQPGWGGSIYEVEQTTIWVNPDSAVVSFASVVDVESAISALDVFANTLGPAEQPPPRNVWETWHQLILAVAMVVTGGSWAIARKRGLIAVSRPREPLS